jgi:hypothetical protein
MTQPIKYDFFGQLGGTHIEECTTADPEQYASELASRKGLDPDEVTWEATATVNGFDGGQPNTHVRCNDCGWGGLDYELQSNESTDYTELTDCPDCGSGNISYVEAKP